MSLLPVTAHLGWVWLLAAMLLPHAATQVRSNAPFAVLVLMLNTPLFWSQSTVDFFYNTSTTCSSNADCSFNRFCYKPTYGSAGRTCVQCWRCYLFPGIYGACPDQCSSNDGGSCYEPTSCGQGLYCSGVIGAEGTTTCQSCFSCLADSDALFGNCSLSCPSGALSAGGPIPQGVANYVFLAFSAAEISSGADSSGQLQLSDVQGWLQAQGLPNNQTNTTLQALAGVSFSNFTNTSTLAMSSFVSTLLNQSSLQLVCPNVPLDGSAPAAVVYPGCPCNATARATSFQCPAGNRCSPAAYHGLSTEVAHQYALGLLQAVCVACESGQYCPQGTYVQNETDLSSLDCLQGSYCPTPAQQLPCPGGSFCVSRTVTPITCDYNYLLNNDPTMIIPLEGQSVIQRLRDDGDPLKGNYCPVNSTKPSTLCSAGYYCPNVTTSILCPPGYFCKSQSLAPHGCGILMSCPAGTGIPQYSSFAFVILAVVLAALPLVWVLLYYLDEGITAKSRDDILRTEIKRSHAKTMDKAMIQHFRLRQTMSQTGYNEEVAQDVNYAGFGVIDIAIQLEFIRLGMRLRSKDKVVLEGVSGYFPKGKMNAVMGPSGSGKTTFLNVLCGKVGANSVITGSVKVNGQYMMLEKLKTVMGFVPQDDIVHVDLTVRENLACAAHLKLPRDMFNRIRREFLIDDALDMLQLKHIQHFLVGSVEKRGISGGQRKRVNIGLELVGAPSLLFLDEPTSGLDSAASSDVLGSMANMAKLGMTVIAVIHQPRFSSYDLFDQVLLLGQGGSTVYMGPPRLAIVYFQKALGFAFPDNENPADILMDIIGGKVQNSKRPDFKPPDLARWWRKASADDPQCYGARPWVDEFVRKNPWFVEKSIEDKELDPATLNEIHEQFDEIDVEAKGRINKEQLKELFMRLDRPLKEYEADAIMKSHQKIGNASNLNNGSRPATADASGRGAGGAEAATSSPPTSSPAHAPPTGAPAQSFLSPLPSSPPAYFPDQQLPPGPPPTAVASSDSIASPFLPSARPSPGTFSAVRPSPALSAALSSAPSLNGPGGADVTLSPRASMSPHATGTLSPHATGTLSPRLSLAPGETLTSASSVRPSPNQPPRPQGGTLRKVSTLLRTGSILTRTVAALSSMMGAPAVAAPPPLSPEPTMPEGPAEMTITKGQLMAALQATHKNLVDEFAQHPLTRLRDQKNELDLPDNTDAITSDDPPSAAAQNPLAASNPASGAPSGTAAATGHRAYSAYAVQGTPWQRSPFGGPGAQSGREQQGAKASPLGASPLGGKSGRDWQLEAGGGGERGGVGGEVGALGEGEEDDALHVTAGVVAQSRAVMEALGTAPVSLPTLPRAATGPRTPGASHNKDRQQSPEAAASEAYLELATYQQNVAAAVSAAAAFGGMSGRGGDGGGGGGGGGGVSIYGPVPERWSARHGLAPVATTTTGSGQQALRQSTSMPSPRGGGKKAGVGGPLPTGIWSATHSNPLSEPEQTIGEVSSSNGQAEAGEGATTAAAALAGSPRRGGGGGGGGGGGAAGPRSPRGGGAGPLGEALEATLSDALATPLLRRSPTTGSPPPGRTSGGGALEPETSYVSAFALTPPRGGGLPPLTAPASPAQPATPTTAAGPPDSAPPSPRGPVPPGRASAAAAAAALSPAAAVALRNLHGSATHSPNRGPFGARAPKPYSRDTVMAEGLLAGVLHSSISNMHHKRNHLNHLNHHNHLLSDDPEFGTAPRTATAGLAVERPYASEVGAARPYGSEAGNMVRAAHASHARSIVDIKKSLHVRRKSMAHSSATDLKGPGGANEALTRQLASRQPPGLLLQLFMLLQRGIVKYLRSFWPLRVIDILLLLAAAFIIGFIHGTKWGIDSVPSNVVMFMTCLGVLSTVTHLRTFSSDRVLVDRETSSGISILAFFLSQNVIDLLWVLASPAIMLGPYYYLTLPLMPFSTFYLVAMCVCWWASGMAYLVSALLPPPTVLMTGVFIALILGAFIQGLSPTIASVRGQFTEYLMGLSYNRWAMEILTISELSNYQDAMKNFIIMLFKGVGLCGMDTLLYVSGGDTLTPREAISFLNVQQTWTFAYCNTYIADGFWALFGLGAVFRLLAFLALRFVRRSQY